jgi:hypothetical protein
MTKFVKNKKKNIATDTFTKWMDGCDQIEKTWMQY